MTERAQKKPRHPPLRSMQVKGGAGALLTLNVKASLTVRELTTLWAQYLEMLDENAAIDERRIQLVHAGRTLQIHEEKEQAVPGLQDIVLTASRRPLQVRPGSRHASATVPEQFPTKGTTSAAQPTGSPNRECKGEPGTTQNEAERYIDVEVHIGWAPTPLMFRARPRQTGWKLIHAIARRCEVDPVVICLCHEGNRFREGRLGDLIDDDEDSVVLEATLEVLGC